MKFEVLNTETGKIVRPYNYYFVLNQNGELWTVNHDLTFTKADAKYKVISLVLRAKCQEQKLLTNYMKGNKINWTEEMDNRLRLLFPITFTRELSESMGISRRSIIRRVRELGIEKEPDFLEKNRDQITKMATEAHPPHPMKGVRGWCVPNSQQTRFKKGQRNGAAIDRKFAQKAWETRRKKAAKTEPKYLDDPEFTIRIFTQLD